MRRTLFAPLISAFLLLACQTTAPGGPLTSEAIAVTPLDAPVVSGAPGVAAAALPATPHPKPRPEDAAAQASTPDPEAVAPAEPETPKTAGQVLCEKSRGQWVGAGETGAFYCASLTRDGGKQCSKKTQCQGVCLARSGTCAPITPLYGCNDVLEKDGRQVTLCID
jgi:hypothetical protein